MSVILFYLLLIGGLALVAGLYIALLVTPIGLIGRRLGLAPAIGFAAAMFASMAALFEPPYGGLGMDFVPAGLRANVYLVGLVQQPPIASLAAGAAFALAGLTLLLALWLNGRLRRPG